MANQIQVTACDNELVVLAFTPSASFELCRILSGNTNSVSVTLNITPGVYEGTIVLDGVNQALNSTIPQTLASGTYSIQLLGLNWGDVTQFTGSVNSTPFNLPLQSANPGLTFSPGPISITV
jgi:hypothetical protein